MPLLWCGSGKPPRMAFTEPLSHLRRGFLFYCLMKTLKVELESRVTGLENKGNPLTSFFDISVLGFEELARINQGLTSGLSLISKMHNENIDAFYIIYEIVDFISAVTLIQEQINDVFRKNAPVLDEIYEHQQRMKKSPDFHKNE